MENLPSYSPYEFTELKGKVITKLPVQKDIIYKKNMTKDLEDSSITFVGLGSLGSYILNSLVDLKIGKIKIIDPDQIAENEVSFGFYSKEDIGRLRCEVWKKRVSKSKRIQSSLEFISADVRNLPLADILDTDIVMLCSESDSILIHEYINETVVTNNHSWFSVRYSDSVGELGPLVISKHTACYECYRLRLKSNQEVKVAPKELRMINNSQIDLKLMQQSKMKITAGYASLEIIRYLTNVERPVTIGGVLFLNFKTFRNSIHRLLRVPNCPGCGKSF